MTLPLSLLLCKSDLVTIHPSLTICMRIAQVEYNRDENPKVYSPQKKGNMYAFKSLTCLPSSQ